MSVVQSRPKKRYSLDDTPEDEVVEDYLQKTKKNIVKKAELEDFSASSKNVKRVNVPDDGMVHHGAYGYVAAQKIKKVTY